MPTIGQSDPAAHHIQITQMSTHLRRVGTQYRVHDLDVLNSCSGPWIKIVWVPFFSILYNLTAFSITFSRDGVFSLDLRCVMAAEHRTFVDLLGESCAMTQDQTFYADFMLLKLGWKRVLHLEMHPSSSWWNFFLFYSWFCHFEFKSNEETVNMYVHQGP